NESKYAEKSASADTPVSITANATISSTVDNDANGNGSFDSGIDTGISGVTVSRSGASSGSTTTAANGSYSFTGLTAGTYSVDYTLPSGYANTGTKPISGITVTGTGTSSGNDFFARRTTSTSLALTTGTNPSTFGDSLTFTATVTSLAGNPVNL